MNEVQQAISGMEPSPLIMVTGVNDRSDEPVAPLPRKKPVSRKKRSVSDQSGNGSGPETAKVLFAYNDYGELVDIEKLKRPIASEELTVTETLRLILKAYHNTFRTKIGYVVARQLSTHTPAGEDGRLAYSGLLSLWNFTPKTPAELPSDVFHNLDVYRGPPRVLEIGCGDGVWCFKVKEAYPDWIIQGLDDTDHWSKDNLGKRFRDFMKFDDVKEETDYFGKTHLAQDDVEFTMRNICTLLSHSNPIPSHTYSFVRARDVFSKLESYKGFLEDVRRYVGVPCMACLGGVTTKYYCILMKDSILQPDGIVEFTEFDPRPRVSLAGRRRSENVSHISRPQTDWTDKIADRFKDSHDEQLATMVPEWTRRAEERLKATLRPRDGVPAANLKSWLEGAGFWDVKQLVMRLPVGGDSPTGRLLLDFMRYQTDLENRIPLLAARLPQPDFANISFGNFYINMHVVSGRKPRDPRPGDMLRNGTRQGMTAPPAYDAAKRADDAKSLQWTRTTRLDNVRLVSMMMKNNLQTLKSDRDQLARSPLLREKSERASE